MAPKTITMALADMLEDLKKADFDKFCNRLVDRREEPRVRRRRVEDKSFLDIADVLVSTFTERRALDVAVEILGDIKCSNYAKTLIEETRGLSSEPGSSGTASSSSGATSGNTEDKHFVDEHMVALINRISNIEPILDQLFDHGVIQQECYDEIRALPITQRKVRALYSGPLKAGKKSKDIFYKVLEENEPTLISDLKKKK